VKTARRLAVAALVLVSVTVLVLPPSAAEAADQCTALAPSVTATPWPQQMLDLASVRPLTTGAHETIAVLDSGVDATQPQLRGQVSAGYDAIRSGGTADTDCLGTGTQVAGAIAATKSGATGVYGVAPAATIVPVRVIGEPGSNMSATPTASALARGIAWAADHHVDVIDVSVWLTTDSLAVRQAIDAATGSGITVIAAVGDLGSADDGDPVTYPASYSDVIGVGAVDATGAPSESSEHGAYVDLVAPGAGVPVLQRDHGTILAEGSTAVAAGFVSGAAALVRARWPQASSSEIAERLIEGATPDSAAIASVGHGIVNPYVAVTTVRTNAAPVPAPTLRPATLNRAQIEAAAAARHSRSLGILWTVIALGALLIVVLLAIGIPRARRRAWRPAYALPLVEREEPIEPVPVAMLFEDP
jgi:membrane-anchored mycosin MYCP